MAGMTLILSALCLNASCVTDNATTSDVSLVTQNTLVNDENIPTSIEEKAQSLATLRNKLNGHHLKVATLDDHPLSYTYNSNGSLIGDGVSFEIINLLKKKFNFTYEVVKPENNIIGSTMDMFGSLVDMLRNQSADIAAVFVPHLSDLRQYLRFSTALDEGEWVMVMLRPAESATGSGLLAPFETSVWILIIVSLLAVGPIIYGLIILRNKLTGDDAQKPYSLSHCAWFVYGALMKQGSTLSPIADSTRLLFATWWIFITILTSFYTANLTAFLTLSKFTLPYNSVDDIARREKHFVAVRGGGIEYAIKNDGEMLNVLNKMITKNRAIFRDINVDKDSMDDNIILRDYVEKKNYVYIRDSPAMQYMLYRDYRFRRTISMVDEKIHCPFAVSRIPFMRKKRSFVYPQQSIWMPLFEPEILNLVESGIVKHLLNKDLSRAEICPQDLAGTERQLRNGDLMMTYYIMLAGFAIAIVVFSSELMFRFINAQFGTRGFFGMDKPAKGKDIISADLAKKNVTPPPSYNTLFYRYGNLTRDVDALKMPSYDDSYHGKRKIINGRDYMVYEGNSGERKLVPIRVPSATLFQYSYTE